MRIYLKIFKDINFGNYKTDIILITTNKIKVSDLKRIIFQRYGTEKDIQRLIIKIGDKKFVTMTDEFPLFFFKIKEKSTIYVEILEKSKKNEDDILKKVKDRENKSKYLKRLNIFQKRPNLDIIKESTIEDMDDPEIKSSSMTTNVSNNIIKIDEEDYNSKDSIENKNNYNKIIKERFVNSILNNKLEEFREIIKIYSDFIDINEPIGKSKKYSPVHYASIYEYCEMMDDLINKYNADVNVISADGWSPLHLCAYKGNLKIAMILLNYKKTNIDLYIPKLGTALHCACKQNNFKMAALLLHRCNPSIKNDNDFFPIDLTIDINIKKLINKTLNIFSDFEENIMDISINKKIKSDISDHVTESQLKQFKFLRTLSYIPPQPARFTGYVYKKGKMFSHYNLRYIEINAVKNLFLRFLSKDDYPTKPKEAVFLRDIVKCRKKKTSEEGKYYIEVVFSKNTHLYRFDSLKACDIWLDEFNKSIDYTKFWINLEKKYFEVQPYLSSLKQDIYEIDYISGEVRKLEINQNKNSAKNKILLNSNSTKNNNLNKSIIKKEDNTKNMINNSLLNNSYINFNSFDVMSILCLGNFGEVVKAKLKSNEEIYLMKIINKDFLMKNNQLKNVINEYNTLKELVSPFIISLHYSFQTSDKLYFVFDYCQGGDLNFHLMHYLFEEDEAKFYIAEIILAIEYLHKNDMVFKNLNPENIFISDDGHIKLADLGLMKEGNNDGNFNDSINKANNVNNCPENVKRGTGKSSDIFGIGAILYEMICGSPPFYANCKSNIKNKENHLLFHDYFSDELKDLLSKLLFKDPTKRIGLLNKMELKNHPWFKDIEWDKLSRKGINPPLNLVSMKKDIENTNYINNEEIELYLKNNNEIDLITNEISKEEKISDNVKKSFAFNRKDNNDII
jgi:serine/threonine protein kinase